MKVDFTKICLFAVILILHSSCETYRIPVDSFRQQFEGLTPSRQVTTQGPTGERMTYKTYPIDYIKAVDNNGNPATLKNSPSIEMRITDTANHRRTFYFDLIRFDGEVITGRESRFVKATSSIPVSVIKKIEVQDGGKKFRYVQ